MSLHTEHGGFYARDDAGRRTRLYLTRAAALAASERLTDAEYAAAQTAPIAPPAVRPHWRRMERNDA